MLNVNLDKQFQKADWIKRPLKDELLEYAIKDVQYLIPLYRELSKVIEDRNLWDAYSTRMQQKILSIENYIASPYKIRKKMHISNKSEQLKRNLIEFIDLREKCARRLNIPRNFCMSNGELIRICEHLPEQEDQLRALVTKNRPLAQKQFKRQLLDLCIYLRKRGIELLVDG